MAIENAKTLNVRIRNKYDSYENWVGSNLVLEAGEIAIAYTTVDVKVDNGTAKHPALLMKVGDGEKTFANLPWLSAKAADVLSVCKNEEDLTEFVNGVIADAGIATNEAMQALAGKVTTAEGKITTLEGKMTTAEGKIATAEAAITALQGLVGDEGTVAAQIDAKIAALNLANTYEAKGEAAKVQTALETYKTTNDAAVQKNAADLAGEIARAKAAEEANANAITAIKDGTTIDSFADVEAALNGKQAAGDYATKAEAQAMADGKDAAIQAAHKAGTDAAAAAKTAQDDVDALKALVGESSVEAQITAKITELDLPNTYDEKGAAAAAETAAKGHADSLNTAMNTRVEALEAIDHDHTNKTVLDGITAEKVAAWDAAEQNAKDHADGLDEAMDLRVKALEGKFGDGDGNVGSQIEAAVAAEAKLRDDADKALQALIEANDADILALQGLVGDETVEKQIADAVKEEADRAKGIEGGLETRLKAVEDDHLVAADKAELEGKIKSNTDAIALLTNGVDEKVVDGVNDLIAYVVEHGTEVTGIKADIKANADAIGKATEGDVAGTGLYKRIEDAEGAIALKAAQADLEAAVERIADVESDLNTETTGLKARMTQAEADIDALEELVGDQNVSEQIEAAIEEAKTDASNKDAVVLAEAQKGIAAVDGRVSTLETEIVKKANDADLAAIAKTGSTDDLVQGSMVLIFDCGGASV
jgi:hypothetical protein